MHGGEGLTSIDPFCYIKTRRDLNNSKLNFCICLSFSSVVKVQMYRVYYRIVFKRLPSAPTHNEACHRCCLLAYADKGMITPEDLPHL